MHIKKITANKKDYLDLLLLADEQEDMVDRYLARGEMFVLYDGGVRAECVVTKEDDGVYELKNIAVSPAHWRQGYGKRLIEHVFKLYPDLRTMLVGTGDCPSSLSFYRACGFTESHRVESFFTDNYDHPIYEDGVQLVDMVYLKRVRYGGKRKYSQEEVWQNMCGRVYFNKDDSNVFVRRKGPASWTMNLGNVWSWAAMGAFVVIVLILLFII